MTHHNRNRTECRLVHYQLFGYTDSPILPIFSERQLGDNRLLYFVTRRLRTAKAASAEFPCEVLASLGRSAPVGAPLLEPL